MRTLARILLWTLVAAVILSAFAAILVPRLINTDSVRNAIVSTISRELGGTLTFDRIVLSVLPRPRIVLKRPRIELPRKLVAQLDSLDIAPSFLHLLAGQFRVHAVYLSRPAVTFLLPEGPSARKEKQQPARQASDIDSVLGLAAEKLPGILFVIDDGTFDAVQKRMSVLSLRGLRARVSFQPTPQASARVFQLAGSASCTIDSPDLSLGPAELDIGRFEAVPGTITFSRATLRMQDLSLDLTGKIEATPAAAAWTTDLQLRGKAGPLSLQWLRDIASLPSSLTLKSPVTLSETRFRRAQNGTLSFVGRAEIANGPELRFDVGHGSAGTSVNKLLVRDRESQASIALKVKDRVVDFFFSGNLTGRTLAALLEHPPYAFGHIQGDLKAMVPLDHLLQTALEGSLEGEQIGIPLEKDIPFSVDHVSIMGRGSELELDGAAVTLGTSKGVVNGTVAARDDGIALDLGMTSPEIQWSDLQKLFVQEKDKEATAGEEVQGEAPAQRPKVTGKLRVDVGALRGKRFVFQPVRGNVLFEKDLTRYEVKEMKVCGINVAGTAAVSGEQNDLSFRFQAKQQELAPALVCLAGADMQVTGTFDLTGTLAGSGPNETLVRSLGGDVAFVARNGRVFNDILVAPILRYKRIADLMVNTTGDARKNGIPYDSFGIKGVVQNGRLSISEGVVRSSVMNLAARGTIDMMSDTLDVTVLIAPYTTVDAVVRNIPLLGKVLGGTLVTVPLSVQGSIKSPSVKPLPPAAVGEGLVGIMRRTLELPFTVLSDLPKRSTGTDGQ